METTTGFLSASVGAAAIISSARRLSGRCSRFAFSARRTPRTAGRVDLRTGRGPHLTASLTAGSAKPDCLTVSTATAIACASARICCSMSPSFESPGTGRTRSHAGLSLLGSLRSPTNTARICRRTAWASSFECQRDPVALVHPLRWDADHRIGRIVLCVGSRPTCWARELVNRPATVRNANVQGCVYTSAAAGGLASRLLLLDHALGGVADLRRRKACHRCGAVRPSGHRPRGRACGWRTPARELGARLTVEPHSVGVEYGVVPLGGKAARDCG